MRDLARRLLAASQTVSDPHVHEAVLVSDKLRISLTRFAGADSFTSLLRRALVLASAEVPSLQSVSVGADGRLEGLEQLAADTGMDVAAAAAAITAHLLGLLVTFIGEPLTRRLVREAWPDISQDDLVDPQRSQSGEPKGVSPRTSPISNPESENSKKSAKRSKG